MIVVHTSSVQVIERKAETQTAVCVDSEIRAETVFTICLVTCGIIRQVGKRRFGVDEMEVVCRDEKEIVRVCK